MKNTQFSAASSDTAVGSTKELDALGARDVRKEKDLESREDEKVAKRRKPAPGTFTRTERPPLPASVYTRPSEDFDPTSVVLHPAAHIRMRELSRNDISTFIPCSQIFFGITFIMNNLLCDNEFWTSDCLGWCPIYTDMYIGTLFLIQTMRAMDAAGILSGDLRAMFKYIKKAFPFSTLPIPGPLVPLFKGISYFNPGATLKMGNVSPAIPSTPGISLTAAYSCNVNMRFLLPAMTLMVGRLHAIFDNANAGRWTNDSAFYDMLSVIISLNGRNATDNAVWRTMLRSPGIQYALPGNAELWNDAYNHRDMYSLPDPCDADTEDDWRNYMFCELDQVRSMDWFRAFIPDMHKYCKHFRSSSTLEECSPSSSSCGAIIVKMTNATSTTFSQNVEFTAAADGQPDKFTLRNSVHSFKCTAESPIVDIPPLEQWRAATSLINLETDPAVNSNPLHRRGPFWDVSPRMLKCDSFDHMEEIQLTIKSEYFIEKP